MTPPGFSRWLIIGSSGSGKSTLARQMSEITGMPAIHLDKCFWGSNWTPTPHEAWVKTQQQLIKADEWIIDGTYRKTLPIRLQRAQAVVFLKYPRSVYLKRLATRYWLQKNGYQRRDITEGCNESMWWLLPHLSHMWQWEKRAYVDIQEKLAMHPLVQVFTLTSPKDIEGFLLSLNHIHRS